MENLSKNRRRGASRAAPNVRLPATRASERPTAVIDIGSNSVRLVVYERVGRNPTPIFNEKTMAGLGREVQSKKMLAADAVARALQALRRFRALCDTMRVGRLMVVATAAARDAKNGKTFIAEASKICGVEIDVISGVREAKLTALGVISGFHRPDGLVGDLGGGSLELIDVTRFKLKKGVTLPLGGLALQDRSGRTLKRADKLVKDGLATAGLLRGGAGRTFYAVGGTWRSLARLHMAQTGYPLHVMHGYVIRSREALEFCRLIRRVQPDTLAQIEMIAALRRPLLAYAALVLENIIRRSGVRQVAFSANGVREGLLFEMLGPEQRREDGLLAAARDLNVLRSRSPRHGEDLIGWTDAFFGSSGLGESPGERRLRHAACLLADIGWRAHPDYRGEQSLNVIAHAGFAGLDHPDRAFLAMAVFYRHVSVTHDEELSPRIRELASTRMLDRARVLGAAMRVAYLVSAAQPGVLPQTPLLVARRQLVLDLRDGHAALAGERVLSRLKQLGRLIGREAIVAA